MKRNKIKKITGLLLTFIMMLSILTTPISSFANESSEDNRVQIEETMLVNSTDTEEAVEVEFAENEVTNLNKDLNKVVDMVERNSYLENIREITPIIFLDDEESLNHETAESKVYKINKDFNQEIDITEEVHHYLESQQELNTRTKFTRALPATPDPNDPNFPVYVDFIIKVNYIKADGSAYEMSDYITDPITINLQAVYVGDTQQDGPVVTENVTDRLTPKTIQVGLKDVYGNGGEEGEDLFGDYVIIDGFTNSGDYLSTNFYANVDSSVFKTTPDGQSLDAYITLSEKTGGNEVIPEMNITFIENPQPDGTLGTAKIKKEVLNETKKETQYKDSTAADLGDVVSYKIEIENRANTVNEVTFEDVLDENLTNVELVRRDLSFEDVIDYDEATNTISGSTAVPSKGIKTFIYKATVGENASEDIRNTVVMTRLTEYKGELSLEEEDKILLADDGDIIEVTDINGVTTEIVVKGDKGFIQIEELDSAVVEVNPPISSFHATKTDSLTSRQVEVGDTFKYSIRVKNTGTVDLENVKISDRVPSELDILNVVPEDAEISGQLVEHTVPTIKVGESYTMTIEVKVNNTAKGGDKIKNIAIVDDRSVPGRELEVVKEVVEDKGFLIIPSVKLNKDNHYAYMIGYPDGSFRPQGNITRAEVTTIFFRMMTDESRNKYWSTTNDFGDVQSTDWFNNAISTMSNAEAVTGYPDGSFKPDANITRGEFATMASRFLSDYGNLTNYKFTDIKGNWAEDSIKKLASHGLINGYEDGSFKPDQLITRAEAATLVNSVLERTPHKDNLLSDMKRWSDNSDTSEWYYAQVQEATNSHTYTRTSVTDKEVWKELLAVRDWSALEKEWSTNATIKTEEVAE
ncbi:S-layer homology domain-containing protein [Anaerosphaera multitolerans]|uniref:DUF11 domain-containing protein n=1 Tax=Anaerosphaera multitolerans TaxID=2487351 RepID=A0A437S4R8_9FIRM|nr:S-layer homology domain-containing protein [Anaerosphaera multitolerans]RVU54009.1 DUF11 domain-containing protein [Anaerosphaera multitolerans]